jgi:hypothetical protein
MSLKIEPNVPQRGVISGQKKPLGLKQAANHIEEEITNS